MNEMPFIEMTPSEGVSFAMSYDYPIGHFLYNIWAYGWIVVVLQTRQSFEINDLFGCLDSGLI